VRPPHPEDAIRRPTKKGRASEVTPGPRCLAASKGMASQVPADRRHKATATIRAAAKHPAGNHTRNRAVHGSLAVTAISSID